MCHGGWHLGSSKVIFFLVNCCLSLNACSIKDFAKGVPRWVRGVFVKNPRVLMSSLC